MHQFAQWPAEPIIKRNAEPHLAAVKQLRGETIPKSGQEDAFALTVSPLPRVRDVRGELAELLVEHGAANFEGCRHGGTVHFDQHVAGQVGGSFEVLYVRNDVA